MTARSQVLATLVALAVVGSGCSMESDEGKASELAKESCELVRQANSGLMAASGGMFSPESAPDLDEVPGIAADAAEKASEAAELGSEQSPEPRIDKRTRTMVTESCSQFD